MKVVLLIGVGIFAIGWVVFGVKYVKLKVKDLVPSSVVAKESVVESKEKPAVVEESVVEKVEEKVDGFSEIVFEKVDRGLLDEKDQEYVSELFLVVRNLTSLTSDLSRFSEGRDVGSIVSSVTDVGSKVFSLKCGKSLVGFKSSVDKLVSNYIDLVGKFGAEVEAGSFSVETQNKVVDCLGAVNRFVGALVEN
jgi:hypothetical protein